MSNSTLLTPVNDPAQKRSIIFCGVALGVSIIASIGYVITSFWFFYVSFGLRLSFSSPPFIMTAYTAICILASLGLSIAAKIINRNCRWARNNIIAISIMIGCSALWTLFVYSLMLSVYSY